MFLLFIRKVISGKEEYEYARLYMTVQLKGPFIPRKEFKKTPQYQRLFMGIGNSFFSKIHIMENFHGLKLTIPFCKKFPTLVDK